MIRFLFKINFYIYVMRLIIIPNSTKIISKFGREEDRPLGVVIFFYYKL